MPRYKLVNGVKIQLTAEEESARDTQENNYALEKQTRINAETTKATKKASGKQKLKDLGLDDEEIKALTGA